MTKIVLEKTLSRFPSQRKRMFSLFNQGAYHSTKNSRRISGNFHGLMVQSFSSVEDDNCSLGIFR